MLSETRTLVRDGRTLRCATLGYRGGTYLPVKQFRFTIEKRRLGGRVIDSRNEERALGRACRSSAATAVGRNKSGLRVADRETCR